MATGLCRSAHAAAQSTARLLTALYSPCAEQRCGAWHHQCAEGSQVKRRVQNGAIARALISEPCLGYALRLEEPGGACSRMLPCGLRHYGLRMFSF